MKNKVRSGFFVSGFLTIASCVLCFASLVLLNGCDNYFKNDYEDNSPTSGKLKVYYDEGLTPHVKNQVYTFEALYGNAELETFPVNDNDAVQALYSDSCEAIVISRPLSEKEKQAFASKQYTLVPTAVAKSGVALITNINTPIKNLTYNQVMDLVSSELKVKDSLNNEVKLNVLFDKNNSSVMFYLSDSLLRGQKFSPGAAVLGSGLEAINFVANNKNTVAFVDFALLSDVDDSVYKANTSKIKFIAVGKKNNDKEFELPSQSSFKLNTYPFTRTIYVIKKTGEFSLAKGFETFVAGPKGQTTFLKQGLLPTKQQERSIEVKLQ